MEIASVYKNQFRNYLYIFGLWQWVFPKPCLIKYFECKKTKKEKKTNNFECEKKEKKKGRELSAINQKNSLRLRCMSQNELQLEMDVRQATLSDLLGLLHY